MVMLHSNSASVQKYQHNNEPEPSRGLEILETLIKLMPTW